MDLELAIALLVLGAAYWINYYIGHRPIDLILIGHLFRTNSRQKGEYHQNNRSAK
jgi:hypothetical protein